MKTIRFLSFFLISGAVVGTIHAQSVPFTPTNNDNPPYQPPTTPQPHVADVQQPGQSAPAPARSADNLDPAKVAEYQQRFQQGYDLEQQGKLKEARDVYDGILAQQPDAKRSLLEAGRISFKLGDFSKANDYLSKLHEIVPDFPEAIELLIQTNEALHHDVKVELLCRDFRTLHDSGKMPALTQSLCFVRERFPQGTDNIVISQFFNYTQDPNTAWMAEVYSADGQLKRRLLLNYDEDATKALRDKDPKYASTQVFTWLEHVLQDGKVAKINAYLQIFALPDYQKFRSAMLIILANPPTPLYSAPVDETQH